MKAQHISCAAVLAIALLVAACQEPSVRRSEDGLLFLGSDEATDVVERVIAPGQRSLILEGFAGSIRLSGVESDVARLTITRRARGESPAEAQSRLESLDIEETGDETSYRYRLTASDRALSRFDIEGTVPAGTPLRIRWVAGDVVVGNVNGSIDVQTQHGSVGYSGSSVVVHLRTRNGAIKARLADVSAGTDVDLLTANGDIVVGMPTVSSAHIEASTSAGSVRVSDIAFVSESLSPMDAGARFQARLGEGTGRVVVATQHGSIDIDTFVPDTTDTGKVSATAGLDESEALQPDTVIADTMIGDNVVAEPDTLAAERATRDSSPSDSEPPDSLR